MSLPSGQVLARLVDPITSTSAQSVFVISPEGESMLRGTDVMLHAAFVASPDANGARWHPAVGGWAAIKQFQITDMRGQTLFILREAARWMHYKLTTMPQSQATDLENELSLVNRAVTVNVAPAALIYTNAVFRSAPTRENHGILPRRSSSRRNCLAQRRRCRPHNGTTCSCAPLGQPCCRVRTPIFVGLNTNFFSATIRGLAIRGLASLRPPNPPRRFC